MRDNVLKFEYLGTRVTVETRDRALLSWLVEFLSPDFAISSNHRADVKIAVVTGIRRFDELRRAALAHTSEAAICFLRDSHNLSLPSWVQSDGLRIIHDKNFSVFTVFDAQRQRIEIVGAKPTRQLRISVMRAVREIMLIELLRKNLLVLHASAFSLQSDGLAIVGPKFSGKTSLLIAGLVSTGGSFVTNDRLVTDITSQGVAARGFPTITSIRNDVHSFFPQLKSELQGHNFDHASSLAELRRRITRNGPKNLPERLSLSPAQLCVALDVPRRTDTKLRALVFPRVDLRKRRSEVEILETGTAADLVGKGLFRAGFPHISRTIFSDFLGHGPLVEVDHKQLCYALVQSLPVYHFTLARDILQQPHRSAEFFAAMFN